MPLEAGTKLGPYEVTAAIGAGGMGEVYRARDTKLNRDVALKVLPEAFVTEPERLARFQREAEVLASLNHPNIAQIYGLEDSGNTTALVLELVEGQTLAERIAVGPMPLDEALDIANQITEALAAAHALGIIHRDLKPANIKITPDGVVKVLDFGLAKAFTNNEAADSGLSQSPTLTKGTAIGAIMGTAAYMSPEQAKGKPVDARTDVWAFGAVLYEMLAGERAFKGGDVSDTLVAVFRDEPDWAALSDETPARVRQAIGVCLRKDAKQRVRDITAVRLALEGAFATEALPAVPAEHSRRRPVPLALFVTLAAAVAGLVGWSVTRTETVDLPVTRTSIVVAQSQSSMTSLARRVVAISPTGTHIAYAANRQLYLRAMDELVAEPIHGTERTNASAPFFSPDGQWLGFYSRRDGQLQKIAIRGGAVVTICTTTRPFGSSWGSDGSIVMGLASLGIFKVSADGGEPELLVSVDAESGERAHGPQILPDGQSVLFTLGRGEWTEVQVVVQSLDSGKRRTLVEGGGDARYVPSGHLVYAIGSSLMAVPFDVDRLEVIGGSVPVVEDVARTNSSAGMHFDFSRNGMLVYKPADDNNRMRELVWVGRDGRETLVAAEPRAYEQARVSPDGTKALLTVLDASGTEDLWVWGFARETQTRLTFDPGRDRSGVWFPDGEHVVFASARERTSNLYRKAVDGTGVVERLTESDHRHMPFAFTPDGSRLVFHDNFDNDFTFSVLTLGGEPVSQPLLKTNFFIDDAEVSRDGRWLAYSSSESDEIEVYVRPFPDVDSARWQISSNGGRFPLWGPTEDELFFWTPDGALMQVAIDAEPTFRPGAPEILIEPRAYFAHPLNRAFDISPDGERFLMIKPHTASNVDDPYAGRPRLVVVQNWFEELKRLVPVE